MATQKNIHLFCTTKDEFQWREILHKCNTPALAAWLYPYSENRRIWNPCGMEVSPLHNNGRSDETQHLQEISVEDFLKCFGKEAPAPGTVTFVSQDSLRDSRIESLEKKTLLFDDILKRLTALEKAGKPEYLVGSFGWAMKQMAEGRKVRRDSWARAEFIRLSEDGFMVDEGGFDYVPVATRWYSSGNWELYTDPQ